MNPPRPAVRALFLLCLLLQVISGVLPVPKFVSQIYASLCEVSEASMSFMVEQVPTVSSIESKGQSNPSIYNWIRLLEQYVANKNQPTRPREKSSQITKKPEPKKRNPMKKRTKNGKRDLMRALLSTQLPWNNIHTARFTKFQSFLPP